MVELQSAGATRVMFEKLVCQIQLDQASFSGSPLKFL